MQGQAVTLSGEELRMIIAARKEAQKQVRLEARVGEQLPPLLALAAAKASLHIGEPGWPTEEQMQEEIARSKARRAGLVSNGNSLSPKK